MLNVHLFSGYTTLPLFHAIRPMHGHRQYHHWRLMAQGAGPPEWGAAHCRTQSAIHTLCTILRYHSAYKACLWTGQEATKAWGNKVNSSNTDSESILQPWRCKANMDKWFWFLLEQLCQVLYCWVKRIPVYFILMVWSNSWTSTLIV